MEFLRNNALHNLRPTATYRTDGDELIWLDEEQVEPTLAEIDAEFARLVSLEPQRLINKEALAYLASTGWYVERLNDPSSGKAIPQDILDARAEARANVV